MPRPLRKRKIALFGEIPESRVFRPKKAGGVGPPRLTLTLDGLEALRLVDLQGLYHEEAARRMGVSRATFSRVLSAARSSVADALVNGKAVKIGGGVVEARGERGWPCPVHGGDRRLGRGCHCAGGQAGPSKRPVT